MYYFLNSIQNLTKLIQEDCSLNPLSFDLMQLANLSDDERFKIQEEVKNIKLIHIHEFWELTEEIYKRLILKTITQELQDYFSVLQKTSTTSLEITYQLQPWKEFILTNSNDQTVTLKLHTSYAEKQIQNLLNHLGIHDENWSNDLYDFDYKFNFESEVESIFRKLAFDAWKKAKSETQSLLKGTFKEANGGSHIYDLDTRQSIP